MSKRKIFRILWFTAVAIFLVWNWSTFQSRDLPTGTFESNSEIEVFENADKISFNPNGKVDGAEVIFFQGGMTDPKAYAPLCRSIAANGFRCHLIKMAWRLPQFDYQKIYTLFDLNTKRYVIGGHSQGAKMAAQFVYENPSLMKGLFLIGTSTPKDIDLSNLTIPTIKLYAENDGLASVEEVMQFKDKLPQNSKLVLIKGGNHSQFGFLGQLFLDNAPEISLQAQQSQTLEELILFLKGLSNKS